MDREEEEDGVGRVGGAGITDDGGQEAIAEVGREITGRTNGEGEGLLKTH